MIVLYVQCTLYACEGYYTQRLPVDDIWYIHVYVFRCKKLQYIGHVWMKGKTESLNCTDIQRISALLLRKCFSLTLIIDVNLLSS